MKVVGRNFLENEDNQFNKLLLIGFQKIHLTLSILFLLGLLIFFSDIDLYLFDHGPFQRLFNHVLENFIAVDITCAQRDLDALKLYEN